MNYNLGIVAMLLLVAITFQNCGKDDVEASAITYISIEEYITQNNVSPIYTDSGLGYIINDSGDTKRAIDESTVSTTVAVKTTDDLTKIDTQGDVLLNLFGQVPALKEGLQLVGNGGNVTLFVPFELGWGTSGNASVPPSADVIIDLTLTDIFPSIEEYIADNNITVTDSTASKVYVLIEEEGDGTFPNVNGSVTVNYSGYFTNGTEFDANDNSSFSLSQVITGWQEGIPKFSKGAKGKLFIPYEAGYGTAGNNAIPGRTDLIFDIELTDF